MKKILVIIFLILPTQATAECLVCGVKDTFLDAFDKNGLIILAVGAGATLIAFNQDQAMHDSWVNYQRMNRDASSFGDFWGTGIPEASIALGQLIFDNEKGIAHTESLLVSTLITYGLKYSSGRQRPESENRLSFPSGHSQVSFVTATHLLFSYGWLYSVPAFGAAVVTGLSRLSDNAHWFSDVVAGAAIGVFFGRSAFKHYTTITPYALSGGGYGLALTYRY
ncbi:MAG: phosphatase PAP2 family protein [Oligoflexia bacterium]|nr:phosphatase PAP2 family protein [Oligoflexia bacterium]